MLTATGEAFAQFPSGGETYKLSDDDQSVELIDRYFDPGEVVIRTGQASNSQSMQGAVVNFRQMLYVRPSKFFNSDLYGSERHVEEALGWMDSQHAFPIVPFEEDQEFSYENCIGKVVHQSTAFVVRFSNGSICMHTITDQVRPIEENIEFDTPFFPGQRVFAPVNYWKSGVWLRGEPSETYFSGVIIHMFPHEFSFEWKQNVPDKLLNTLKHQSEGDDYTSRVLQAVHATFESSIEHQDALGRVHGPCLPCGTIENVKKTIQNCIKRGQRVQMQLDVKVPEFPGVTREMHSSNRYEYHRIAPEDFQRALDVIKDRLFQEMFTQFVRSRSCWRPGQHVLVLDEKMIPSLEHQGILLDCSILCLQVCRTATYVDVLWDNATVHENVRTTELRTPFDIAAHDVAPGDYVCSQPELNNTQRSEENVGIVLRTDPSQRTVVVRWLQAEELYNDSRNAHAIGEELIKFLLRQKENHEVCEDLRWQVCTTGLESLKRTDNPVFPLQNRFKELLTHCRILKQELSAPNLEGQGNPLQRLAENYRRQTIGGHVEEVSAFELIDHPIYKFSLFQVVLAVQARTITAPHSEVSSDVPNVIGEILFIDPDTGYAVLHCPTHSAISSSPVGLVAIADDDESDDEESEKESDDEEGSEIEDETYIDPHSWDMEDESSVVQTPLTRSDSTSSRAEAWVNDHDMHDSSVVTTPTYSCHTVRNDITEHLDSSLSALISSTDRSIRRDWASGFLALLRIVSSLGELEPASRPSEDIELALHLVSSLGIEKDTTETALEKFRMGLKTTPRNTTNSCTSYMDNICRMLAHTLELPSTTVTASKSQAAASATNVSSGVITDSSLATTEFYRKWVDCIVADEEEKALPEVDSLLVLPHCPADFLVRDNDTNRSTLYSQAKKPALPGKAMKILQRELQTLKKNLPAGILVIAFEEPNALLRAVVAGPAGTPYSHLLFVFDITLPSNYPVEPPAVHYHSRVSEKLNPNLYEDGKVCLSLLGTWQGKGTQVWVPGSSSLLQLLISLRSLILVPFPYFCEAGYDKQTSTQEGEASARRYNEAAFLLSLQTTEKYVQEPPACLSELFKIYYERYGQLILRVCDDLLSLEDTATEGDTSLSFPESRKLMEVLPQDHLGKGFLLTLRKVKQQLRQTISSFIGTGTASASSSSCS